MLGQRSAGEFLVDVEDRVLPPPCLHHPAAATLGVSEWIETVYNRRRRHSALGNISPVAFEHRTTTAAQAA